MAALEKNNICILGKHDEITSIEIVVFLPSPPSSLYQLAQWENTLYKLNKSYKVAIVTTNLRTFIALSSRIKLLTFYTPGIKKLKSFYSSQQPAVILYLNNSLKNSQSVLYRKGFHIFLNHGESEKECMSSNQSKAYDYVFVVGKRAVGRYEENLLNFDQKKYIIVGRPQLDNISPIFIDKKENQKIILYAPTWEAHFSKMDYCSLEQYGLSIAKAIIDDPQLIFVYKPHPLIGSKRKTVNKIHKKILDLIKHSSNAYYFNSGDINKLFPSIDFSFFDNSSVMIDYLHIDKPAAYIEVRSDIEAENLLQGYHHFREKNLNETSNFIANALKKDTKKDKQRRTVKEYYLGGFKEGESTKVFIETIGELINKRNAELPAKIHSRCELQC